MAHYGCEACSVASSVAKRCKAGSNNKLLLPLLCGKVQVKNMLLFHAESFQAKFQVATSIMVVHWSYLTVLAHADILMYHKMCEMASA